MIPTIIDLKTKKNGKYVETIISKLTTLEKTKELIDRRLPIEEIARLRGFTMGTIESHIVQLIESGLVSVSRYVDLEKQQKIEEIYKTHSASELKPIKDLYPQYSYLELKAVKADLNRTSKIKCYE